MSVQVAFFEGQLSGWSAGARRRNEGKCWWGAGAREVDYWVRA